MLHKQYNFLAREETDVQVFVSVYQIYHITFYNQTAATAPPHFGASGKCSADPFPSRASTGPLLQKDKDTLP